MEVNVGSIGLYGAGIWIDQVIIAHRRLFTEFSISAYLPSVFSTAPKYLNVLNKQLRFYIRNPSQFTG